MKKVFWAAGILILLFNIIGAPGCSKEKEPAPQASAPAAVQEAVLPELAQNAVPPPSLEPDFTFEPVSNNLEAVPADANPSPNLD